jgi:hypothetical protein
MPYCEFCGVEMGYLPFKCKYCGSSFCDQHRLPENHNCSFELKHKSLAPATSREKRSLYQDVSEREPVSEEYLERESKELKKYLKEQEKQRKRAAKSQEKTYRGVSTYAGTKFLMCTIIIFSIVALIFDSQELSQYIYLSLNGLIYTYMFHTIITAFFIAPTGGIFGIFILFIMIYFLYNIAKNLEFQYGTRFLIKLYINCCLFTALFFVLLRLLLVFYFPIKFYPIYIGLAWGGIYGLISFLIFPIKDREMTSLVCFIPIRIKGKYFLLFLVLIRLIPGLLFAIFSPLDICIYLPDLGGILGAYLVYRYRYLKR